jgi:hypothetical protein
MKRVPATRRPSVHRVDVPLSDLDCRRLWTLARYLNVDPQQVVSTALHLLAVALRGNPLCQKKPLPTVLTSQQRSEPGYPTTVGNVLKKLLPTKREPFPGYSASSSKTGSSTTERNNHE